MAKIDYNELLKKAVLMLEKVLSLPEYNFLDLREIKISSFKINVSQRGFFQLKNSGFEMIVAPDVSELFDVIDIWAELADANVVFAQAFIKVVPVSVFIADKLTLVLEGRKSKNYNFIVKPEESGSAPDKKQRHLSLVK